MQYVLITGAAGGIGAAAAETLRQAGFYVFALDRQSCAPKENLLPLTADITDTDSLQAACKQVAAVTDSLYAVLHFAGLYVLDSLVELPQDRLEQIFRVNVLGAMAVNRTFLPLLKKGSRIVLTTSELAPLDPLPFTGLYAVTKSALDKYAFSLRMELQLLGILVSVLRPGAVATDMLGVSTAQLDAFCENTRLYSCNAKRFKAIVEAVEARNIPPKKVAQKVLKILTVRHPRYVYSLNRNPLLLLMHLLPKRVQTWIIGLILK